MIDEQLFKKYYLEDLLSIEEISKKLNLTYNKVLRLAKKLNLTRDKRLLDSKATKRRFDKNFELTLTKIPRDELYDLYITQNYSYNEILDKYNLTGWTFDRILKHYDIKKSRTQSSQLALKTKYDKYGISNNNNWRKGQNTRILNNGSLAESYAAGLAKQKATMLEKYGYESSLLFSNSVKRSESKPNQLFSKKLDILNIEYEKEFVLDNYIYDFRINNILIEVNPSITHNTQFNPFNKKDNYSGIHKDYHYNKTLHAKSKGYRCVNIWDWDDIDKLIHMLKEPSHKVAARKCVVKEVGLKQARDFINKYHCQNHCRDKIRVGLFYNDELISIMTFGKPRYNKKYEYELLRYCVNYDYIILGGAEKLFNYFIKNYKPNSIISYCDYSKFTGDVYTKLNFKYLTTAKSCLHWYSLKTKEHYTHNLINKQGFSRVVNHIEAKDDIDYGTDDNNELMLLAGFLPVNDSGQGTYIWTSTTKAE